MTGKLTKKQKKWLRRIELGAVGFIVLEVLAHAGAFDGGRWWLGLLTALVPYLIVGWDVIRKSIRNISHGEVFDENFLMMVATFGAFGIGEYPEAVAVMLLYQIGELFQNYATGKSRESISQLMSIAPETALVERGQETEEVDPDEVEVGETIVVRPGEKIPLDGEVIEGSSMLDTSALTGESVPRSVHAGDSVISGCVNGKGTLKIRTTKRYEDSTVAKILELVENATDMKTRVENFVTRFARVYTPIVTVGALILAVIPPLILGGGAQTWISWIRRACIFLVVSCPCALVISVPLGFFGGIGAASRIGVLVKGSNYLEMLARVKTIVFDKTGTLTKGEFRVTEVAPSDQFERMTDEPKLQLLEMAAYAEAYSTHPVAESIRAAWAEASAKEAPKSYISQDTTRIGQAEEIAGHGVLAVVDGRQILAGNEKLMQKYGISLPEGVSGSASESIPESIPEGGSENVLESIPESSGRIADGSAGKDGQDASGGGTVVYVACDGTFAGRIVISDVLKEGVPEAIRSLKEEGVSETVMLTGDNASAAKEIARQAGVDKVYAQLLPADKVRIVEQLIKKEKGKGALAFAGDGINDAPVLMRSDVGIAMGLIGSDAAIEAADIVLMDDDVRKIAQTVRIARKTMGIIRANITFAIAVKIGILVLSALGVANMWMAIFGDVGVLILCILNAMRLLGHRRKAVPGGVPGAAG